MRSSHVIRKAPNQNLHPVLPPIDDPDDGDNGQEAEEEEEEAENYHDEQNDEDEENTDYQENSYKNQSLVYHAWKSIQIQNLKRMPKI